MPMGPGVPAVDLGWTVVQMRAGERIVVNEALIIAYQAASSPHSIRALKSDIEAFDSWCRRTNRIALGHSSPALGRAGAAEPKFVVHTCGRQIPIIGLSVELQYELEEHTVLRSADLRSG